ncbi:DHH family phosphoesterase [Fundicoccus culcitae]|uniref:Cyclic-di-AMP phosphodiesterase n=1 Tax=Fundicoccus culcitae TaxID=2969821 RepID=A0ABY5P2Y3_9LACT|nr:DHH family phosphoesterase [Fundicoccus culcitae]UUX33057.1 DHH family phosphoesterase [Fundicoccus culcitae]
MISFEKIKEFFRSFNELKISWQIYSLMIFYILIMIATFVVNWQIGVLQFILLLAMILVFFININSFAKDLNHQSTKLSTTIDDVQHDSLFRSPIAAIIYDENLKIRWVNPAMQRIFGKQDILGESMIEVDNQFASFLDIPSDKKWHAVKLKDKHYKLMHQKENNSFYLIDVSKEYEIIENRKYDRVVFGYLLLEEYDEIVQSMDDQQSTTFDAEIVNELNNWALSYNIFFKRLSDDKFMLIFNQAVLETLEKDNFRYFDQLRERSFLNNVPITVSIGIASSLENTYHIDDLAKQAQLNLDLALGRGGDQIVVKVDEERARFYGGKTNPSEKRTNVRSKLVYQALSNLIEQSDQVFISGHKTPDLDSMASAIGILNIVRQFKKVGKIIINPNELNQDIQSLLAYSPNRLELNKYMIDIKQAQSQITDRSLIVMVDHHRPSLSEAETILENHRIVIIDHHRRGEDIPKQTELTYIEPYASSTAELVTEFFINNRLSNTNLNKFEATALLAGIIVDTNNFSQRVGSKTFDVASYLKARGANTNQINRILKEDFDDIIARNDLFAKTEYLGNGFAVSRGTNEEIIDNVTAAQTADMILDVNKVEASFVIYRRSENVVGISARSLGEVNVQTIMEQLDGGGHLSNAATQLEDKTVEEVYDLLKSVLFLKEEEESK